MIYMIGFLEMLLSRFTDYFLSIEVLQELKGL